MIIQKKNLKRTLFIDIETVSEYQSFFELSNVMQALWKRKCKQFDRSKADPFTDDEAEIWYAEKAGIFAEFAKVACITVGYLSSEKGEPISMRLKSFYGEEHHILSQFKEMMDHHYDKPDEHFICGHNVKEFDVPFLCRRFIINGIGMPRLMNIAGKKPWQIDYIIDTMELWRFGDYKNYTSLALLAATLGIPTPKDDIDGSMVGKVYWEEEDIERIVKYCEKDVITVAQIIMKYAGQELIELENISVAE